MKLEWRDVPIGDGPPISTSLTQAETDELRRLAKDKDVLEIGSAFGYSTVVLAQVAKSVTAVDPHEQLRSLRPLLDNLDAYGITDVDVKIGTSRQILPGFVHTGRRFDLVWIDGDHARDQVAYDVDWARQLLREGGTLACHDYLEDTCPGVAEALDAWRSPPRLVDTLAVYGPGEW